MRRGGPQHPKVALLAADLGVEHFAAVGILECLWHWTAMYAPHGDIGRYPDVAIEGGIGWRGESGALVASLLRCRFLDPNPKHRLVVHHWNLHADQVTQRIVSRSGRNFVDGRKPTRKEASRKLARASQRIASGGISDGVAEHCVKTKDSQQEGASSSTPLSAQSGTDSKVDAANFATWYAAYPRKDARGDAEKAWRQTAKIRPLLATMLAALAWQRPLWAEKERQFTPLPGTYLRGHRWLDECPSGVAETKIEDLSKITVSPIAARLNALGVTKEAEGG